MHEFEYFLSDEAEKYCFYKIPKELFTNSFFDKLSTQAKLMYGLMLDRVGLSRKNGWIDEQGRVYIIFTIKEMQNLTHWTKCFRRLFRQHLLEDMGLLITVRANLQVKSYSSIMARN